MGTARAKKTKAPAVAVVAARPRLIWEEGVGLNEWEAASVCYAATEGELTWRVRPHGKQYSLYASDEELIGHLPKKSVGPYPDAERAKAVCQELDDEYYEQEGWAAAAANCDECGETPGKCSGDCAAGSMLEHGPAAIASGRLDPGTAKPQAVLGKRPPRAEVVMVPIDQIDVSQNIRTPSADGGLFPPGSLDQLRASIAELGLLDAVLLVQARPGSGGKPFLAVGGHRRIAAVSGLGATLIKAEVYSGEGVDARWIARARLAENLHRSDLNHIELAREFGISADAGLTVREIAEAAHVSDDHARRHLALRRLCPPVAALTASGRLPVQQAELISRVGDPARQISLAESATRLSWDAKAAKWMAQGGYDYRTGKRKAGSDEQGVQDRDYVKPMEQLRGEVASAMRGMAACGWPMGEEYSGKRGCTGCPDNSATYADQPMLFEGIEPRGSAKKGFCTNGSCYDVKKAAWDKVLDKRRKDAAAAQKKAVAKAKKAGLDVCEAVGCGKVIPEGEKAETVGGLKMCAKCASKAKTRAERHGNGGGSGESYEVQQQRCREMKKRFPETAEQRLAVAIHRHGADLAEMIAVAIADGSAGLGSDVHEAELVIWAQGHNGRDVELPRGFRPTLDVVLGGGMSNADLAEWWRAAARWAADYDVPGVNYHCKIVNVPLPAEHLERIADLAAVASACGVDVPARPAAEAIAGEALRDELLGATRADFAAVMGRVTEADNGMIADILVAAAVGTLKPKPAKWRIAALAAHLTLAEATAAAVVAGSQEPVAGLGAKAASGLLPSSPAPAVSQPATGDGGRRP